MSITNELNEGYQDLTELNITFNVVGKFRKHANETRILKNFVQNLVDSGEITNIPPETKSALTTYWQELKSFIATIEADSAVMETLTWKAQ